MQETHCHYHINIYKKNQIQNFFNWDSLHAGLKSHCKAWSYNKKKHEKIEPYR